MNGPVVERAHAKLNVFLRVLGRLDDGYHDIQTLILPLELHDTVTVEPATGFSVTVEGERAADLEHAGGESIVRHAAERFAAETGLGGPPAVHVHIEKRIPVSAGMGGGSADAAAVLRVLAREHGIDDETLQRIAATTGADVAAMLATGPVYAEGRGERVAPVHGLTTHWVIKPFGFTVRTPDAYAWWDEGPVTGPDPGALLGAYETGNLEVIADAAANDLQRAVAARHPAIGHAIEAFVGAGALAALMTGSGPTVVALARDPRHADALAAAVRGTIVTAGPPRTMTS
jgi:4-diphosphocytidyl-2-C-methyl-D-erythritol kinase